MLAGTREGGHVDRQSCMRSGGGTRTRRRVGRKAGRKGRENAEGHAERQADRHAGGQAGRPTQMRAAVQASWREGG